MSTMWNLIHYLPGASYFQSWFKKNPTPSLESTLILNILEFLPPSKAAQCSLVSKHWNYLSSSFPKQILLRKIQQKAISVLLHTATSEQEKNVIPLCNALYQLLRAYQDN